jgi:hypothetical protein
LGFFCRIGARYVVRGEQVWPEDRERERALAGLIDRNPSFFEETRRFDRFTVYQLVGCPSMAERL